MQLIETQSDLYSTFFQTFRDFALKPLEILVSQESSYSSHNQWQIAQLKVFGLKNQ